MPPLWLESVFVALLAYGGGVGIGWLIWKRK
jgi:hypothetical protein